MRGDVHPVAEQSFERRACRVQGEPTGLAQAGSEALGGREDQGHVGRVGLGLEQIGD